MLTPWFLKWGTEVQWVNPRFRCQGYWVQLPILFSGSGLKGYATYMEAGWWETVWEGDRVIPGVFL